MLADAAFGSHPGLGAAELPEPRNPLDSWHRAVILGGRGDYAAARTELRRLRRSSADPVLLSLAASTEASLLRQLGWHARASAADGRAAALIVPIHLDAPGRDGPDRLDASCDALTGLAADALGTGRLALATRLLSRAQDAIGADGALGPDGALDIDQPRWRARVRWHWVCAETALASGEAGPATVHAETALRLARRSPSIRHRVKSLLLVAAASAAVGETTRALSLAETVTAECRAYGLLPLRWASAMLRAGVSVGSAAADATAEAAACAATIGRRGGRFR